MIPPDFIQTYQGKGLDPGYCDWCVYVANVKGLELVCMKHGALVNLYSHGRDYRKRLGSDTPIVTRNQVEERYPFGLSDFRKV